MARPKEFDEAAALETAMYAFWDHGYEATSTQHLTEATGLGRSSIYNTFKSKHHLFTLALSRYIEMMTDRQLAILDDTARSPLERIRDTLQVFIEVEFGERRFGRSMGCMVANTTVELAARDDEVAELIRKDQARRIDALAAVLAEGVRAGEITDRQDPHSLAHFLNAAAAGMRVVAQGGGERELVQGIADTTVLALAA